MECGYCNRIDCPWQCSVFIHFNQRHAATLYLRCGDCTTCGQRFLHIVPLAEVQCGIGCTGALACGYCNRIDCPWQCSVHLSSLVAPELLPEHALVAPVAPAGTRNRLTQPSTTGKLCSLFLTSCATSHIPIMCASSVQGIS